MMYHRRGKIKRATLTYLVSGRFEDEKTEVVFAAKPDQLKIADNNNNIPNPTEAGYGATKIAEKTSNKRQRGKDKDNYAKVEAVKMCRKMPSARAKMLMEAMPKSDNVLNKKSKKMSSPSRKSHIKSSDRSKYQDTSVVRKLATSSFR